MVILGCEASLWYVSGPGRADKKPATTGESVCTRGPCLPSLYWCLWCTLSLFRPAEITGLFSDDGSGLTRPFRLAYSADTSLISYDDMSSWQWCKNLMLATLLMEILACFREVLLRSRLQTSNMRCDLDTIIVEALFCFISSCSTSTVCRIAVALHPLIAILLFAARDFIFVCCYLSTVSCIRSCSCIYVKRLPNVMSVLNVLLLSAD